MKRILSVLLALVMALGLLTTTAFAEPDETTTIDGITIDVLDYEFGKMGNEINVSLQGSASGVAQNSSVYVSDKYVFTNISAPTNTKVGTDYYKANAQYYLNVEIRAEGGYAISDEVRNVSWRIGRTGDYASVSNHLDDGKLTATITLPTLEVEFFNIPFTTKVTKSGTGTPGTVALGLDVITVKCCNDNDCPATTAFPVIEGDSYTMTGTSYNGALGFQLDDLNATIHMLLNGEIIIRQKPTTAGNWTFDTTAWKVELKNAGTVNALTAEGLGRFVLRFTPGTYSEANGFAADQNAATVDTMTFTNTYTGSTGGSGHYYSPAAPRAEAPKTFDAGVAIYGVTALLSVTGGAWLVGKKRG